MDHKVEDEIAIKRIAYQAGYHQAECQLPVPDDILNEVKKYKDWLKNQVQDEIVSIIRADIVNRELQIKNETDRYINITDECEAAGSRARIERWKAAIFQMRILISKIIQLDDR